MKRLLALLLVLVLCLALAACGDSKKKSRDDDDDEDEDEGTTTSTTVTGEEGDGSGEVWDEIVNPGGTQTRVPATQKTHSDVAVTDRTYEVTTTTVNQQVYDEPETETPAVSDAEAVAAYVDLYKDDVAAMSGDQMMMSLEARGTAVVYLYVYTTVYDYSTEMANTLFQGMEAQSSTLATALSGMQSECPQVTAMIYEYYTADGDLILSYEYQ